MLKNHFEAEPHGFQGLVGRGISQYIYVVRYGCMSG